MGIGILPVEDDEEDLLRFCGWIPRPPFLEGIRGQRPASMKPVGGRLQLAELEAGPQGVSGWSLDRGPATG